MAVAVILVKGFPYVALEHLCHKTVSCSANGSYLLKNGTAFSTIFQRSFQSINLTPNAANTDKDLFFLFRSTGYYLPHYFGLYIL